MTFTHSAAARSCRAVASARLFVSLAACLAKFAAARSDVATGSDVTT